MKTSVPWISLALAACAAVGFAAPAAPAEKTITLQTLLDEMIDRDALARFPEPAYTLRQASSYDRRSKTPEDREGWMANSDWSQFIRSEKVAGRTEWVMLDVDGPGCVVRIWSGGPKPKGKLRFYFDGAAEPAIAMQTDDLVGGQGLVGPPLSAVRARGLNLYLPIPYAKHLKITYDGPNPFESKNGADNIWYNINYRTYAAGTKVESYSPAAFQAAKDKIAVVQWTLVQPWRAWFAREHDLGPRSLKPGESTQMTFFAAVSDGGAALRHLTLCIEADDVAAATRMTVLTITFDGEQTVWCPVGDFFGSGVGVNPYADRWLGAGKSGRMSCSWVMPFERMAVIRLTNYGKEDAKVTLFVQSKRWAWDDRSMHFHCTWRQQYPLKTRPMTDWNYVDVKGQGVYVGDTLALYNPVPDWWGEGDEKIYVDGEKFPSHFGTGSEDYYGYAWGNPTVFSSPFHAQPRVDGPGNMGHTTNTRVRLLDGIPFQKSLSMNIEAWHWADCEMAFAAATYWYARPGATSNRQPDPKQLFVHEHKPPRIEGALEGEEAKIVERTGGETEVQRFRQYGWSRDAQLWWRDGKPGDRLVLAFTLDKPGKYTVKGNFTKAVDYGTFQLRLDGQALDQPIDFYNKGVVTTGEIELATLELAAGEHKLSVEITGANPLAVKRHMIGIDYLKLERK